MKALVKIKGLFLLALLWVASAGSFESFAQCSQNNIIVTGYQLRNEFGEVFSVTDDYELGEPVVGELWVIFGGSTANGYNLTMYYDIFNNGSLVGLDQMDCLFPGLKIVQNTWVKVRDISWAWGDVIEIKNIFMFWDTGNAGDGKCKLELPSANAQCYTNSDGFTAAVPLFPKFDFASNGICNTTIEFISETIGGSPPFNYTFSWDFDGLGTATGANPVFNFPATGTYTIGLTANDGVSVTTVYKDIFIDPNFGIQVSVLPTKLNDDSGTGIIYVQNVTGGTPDYSFAWTGPDGFMSNDRDIFGLKSGLYTLLVTDANGCQQTEQYYLDVASVLKFEWQSFEVIDRSDRVQIIWDVHHEVAGSEYILERSLGNAENFVPISGIFDVGHSDAPVRYELSDSTFPVFEKNIYYRLIKRFGSLEFISPIKSVLRNTSSTFSWIVYPNPSSGQAMTVANTNWNGSFDSSLRLELFDSGNYFQQVELNNLFQNKVELNTVFREIPKGILYLRIIQDGKVDVIKLINSD